MPPTINEKKLLCYRSFKKISHFTADKIQKILKNAPSLNFAFETFKKLNSISELN